MSDVEVMTTDDDIAIVTLNRPERRNALSNTVLGTLHRTFDEIAVVWSGSLVSRLMVTSSMPAARQVKVPKL